MWIILAVVDTFKTNPWLWPAILFSAGLMLGLFFEYLVLPVMARLARRTTWELDDVLFSSLRGIVFVWCACAGIHFSVSAMPIASNTVPTIMKFNHADATTAIVADANGVAATVTKSVAEKIDVVGAVDKVLVVLLIGSLTIFVMRLAVSWMGLYTRRNGKSTQGVTLFTNITKVAIIILGSLVILQTLGVQIAPILTALGVGGLAVALALQDTLSNLFAGLHIIASKQIRQGDFVKLESGDEGYVADITWRNTTIRALPNNMIIVPNSKLASATIVNFYKPEREMGFGVPVGVSYDSDLEKVERVTIEVAKEVLALNPGGAENFTPVVRFHTFGDFSVNFNVGLRVKEYADQYLLKHEFVKALHRRYKEENIDIPFPIRTVEMKSQPPVKS